MPLKGKSSLAGETDHDDDDIQIVYHSNSSSIKCPTCSLDLTHLPPEVRNEHCNEHFSEEAQGQRAQTGKQKIKSVFKPRSFSKRDANSREAHDIFWRSSQNTTPPQNFTPGLIPLIKKSLVKSHAKGATQKAYLCSPVAVHIGSEMWDRGWGCGYRNYLMACAALMDQDEQPRYGALLESPYLPGILRLQKLIEEAWKNGYDEEGASQLDRSLYNTHKWIGTAELYVAFTFKAIPACLVDFELNKLGIDALIKWIVDYFAPDTERHSNINQALLGASPVAVTGRLPIVLQHSGHSRTVIGFERRRDGSIDLLIFDPSRGVPAEVRAAALSSQGRSEPASGDRVQQSAKSWLSPSKFVKNVLHTNHNRRKRSASSPDNDSAAKRVRAGNDDEVIVIDSDDDNDENRTASTTDRQPLAVELTDAQWGKVADTFRVKAKDLAKKDKYQILYFPLTDPLTDSERRSRKVVTSKKIS